METRGKPTQFVIAVLIATVVLVASAFESAAYDTATGTKPDLQSKRTIGTSTKPFGAFEEICRVAGGRSAKIADIFNGLLPTFQRDTYTLDSLSNDRSQIVIGNISNPTIADLAEEYYLNVTDLGDEGYVLISRPNKFNPDNWIVFILADGDETESKGLLSGVCTLVDLIDGNGHIANYRIRDYPDQPFRGLVHWFPALPETASSYDRNMWWQCRTESISALASTGCNALIFGGNFWRMDKEIEEDNPDSDFWRLDTQVGGTTYGHLYGAFALFARWYGMEPIPEIGCRVPQYIAEDYPLWREGEYIEEEPFIVTSVGGELIIVPQNTSFDNTDNNMSFEEDSSPQDDWPDGWIRQPPIGSAWTRIDANGDKHSMIFNGTQPGEFIVRRLDRTLFYSNSFYVLKCVFRHVAHNGDDAPKLIVEVKPYDSNKLCRYTINESVRETIGDNVGTMDFYFWTLPELDEVPYGYEPDSAYAADGLKHEVVSYWGDVEKINIKIWGAANTSITCDELYLERRASELRNVMIDKEAGLGCPYSGGDALSFTIYNKNKEVEAVCGSDYEIIYPGTPDWEMFTGDTESNTNVTEIAWLQTGWEGDTVLVSYTTGVPKDWRGAGQMTTFCLENEDFLNSTYEALENFYQYFINPKYVHLRVDEIRGMNRCGRCVDEDKTNDQYLLDFINNVQGMLDDLNGNPAYGGHPGETKLLISQDMICEYHTGGDPAYQYRLGGRWGTSAFDTGDFAQLDPDGEYIIIMGYEEKAGPARDAGWPGAGDNVKVIASMISEGPEKDEPETYVTDDTWYEDDAIGFLSIGYDESHDEDELRMLDYAWKRHSNPDATMHAFFGNYFMTDDVGGRTVNIVPGEGVTFAPFGYAEIRNPNTQNYEIKSATIDYGNSSDEVTDILNKEKVTHHFNRAGTKDVTLTVNAGPSGGSTVTHSQTAVITVRVEDETIPQQVEETTELPVPFGLRTISPNPFNPTTSIEFGLARRGPVELVVYDVQGRHVKTLINQEIKSPGVHSVAWEGTNSRGNKVASGVYFALLRGENQTQTRKLVLLK